MYLHIWEMQVVDPLLLDKIDNLQTEEDIKVIVVLHNHLIPDGVTLTLEAAAAATETIVEEEEEVMIDEVVVDTKLHIRMPLDTTVTWTQTQD